jgi:hypothetical protein
MWVLWACTYMHQMYPLIIPDLTKGINHETQTFDE